MCFNNKIFQKSYRSFDSVLKTYLGVIFSTKTVRNVTNKYSCTKKVTKEWFVLKRIRNVRKWKFCTKKVTWEWVLVLKTVRNVKNGTFVIKMLLQNEFSY